jgi:WD40 repeat protein
MLIAASGLLSVAAILAMLEPSRPVDGRKARLRPVFESVYCPTNHDVVLRGLNGHLCRLPLDGGPLVFAPSRVPGLVTSLDTTDDGNVLVTGRLDGTVVVEDSSADGRGVRVVDAHADSVAALAISPGGTLFATGDDQGKVRVWDFASSAALREYSAHSRSVQSLCWLPDGRLVSTGFDGAARLWDTDGSEEAGPLREFAGHAGPVFASAVSPDGRHLATGDYDGIVRLWDVETGVERWRHETPGAPVTAVAFARDGSGLACATGWGEQRLWLLDLEDGRVLQSASGHHWGKSMQFTKDGTQLVTAGVDGTVRLWDVGTWKLVRVFEWPY